MRNNFYKTGYPLSVYFLLLVLVLSFYLMIPASLLKIIFYLLLITIFYYLVFCRYACAVVIDETKLTAKYFFPWENSNSIDLNMIKTVDYAKGYYDIFADKSLGGVFGFPKYCYDQLIIETVDGECKLLNINTRLFTFSKIYKLVSTHT